MKRPVSFLIIGFLGGIAVTCLVGLGHSAAFPLLGRVQYFIQTNYVDRTINERDLEYGAIRGYLAALKDPHTRFIDPDSFKAMQNRLKGQATGIGIQLIDREGHLMVSQVITQSPAYKAGIKRGDQLVSIDGQSTLGMDPSEAIARIRGPVGTLVRVEVGHGTGKRAYVVERDLLMVSAVDRIEIMGDVGYFRIVSFESLKAPEDVRNAVKELQRRGAKGVIVDLRNNGGGLFSNAVKIASLFLSEVPVVYSIDRYGTKFVERAIGIGEFDRLPLVVLVNEGSASSSEIFAGAIKDYNRGKLVGADTYGKASMQKVLTLPDGSAVLYTYARYLTPLGKDISKTGVKVDVAISKPGGADLAADDVDSMEKDPQLQEARRVLINNLY
jgi:carboxyl-terminal processing protease